MRNKCCFPGCHRTSVSVVRVEDGNDVMLCVRHRQQLGDEMFQDDLPFDVEWRDLVRRWYEPDMP